MTDKEKIKQEIERRYNCEKCYPLDIEANVAAAVLQELLVFIDSIPEEPTSESLEEAATFYADTHTEWFDSEGNPRVMPAFKAGAEWQKHQMKETLQTEYEKGRFDMREEMMKDAVNGTVCHRNGNVGDIYFQSDSVLSAKFPFKYGERIKIIIVKNVQQ